MENAILNLRVTQVDEAAAMLDQSGNLCAFVSSAGDFSEATLRHHCLEQLPSHMVPVRFRLVTRLPKTSSGKLDRRAILAMLSLQQVTRHIAIRSTTESHSLTNVGDDASTQVVDAVSAVWQEVLASSTPPEISDSWFELGGTSLSAVAMLERVSIAVKSLLGRTSHVLQLRFADLVANPTLGGICASIAAVDVSTQQLRKRARIDHESKQLTTAGDAHLIRQRLTVDAAGGWLLAAGVSRMATFATTEAGPVWCVGTWDGHVPHTKDSSDVTRCGIHTRWRYNVRACVDGAPAWLMVGGDAAAGVAVIASHAGVIAAVSVDRGSEYWSRQLKGRVDASVSVCLSDVAGKVLACVGSYNGTIYFIRLEDGSIAWEYSTGAEVRCMVCVECGERGIVWCGSHDHCLYALSVQQRQCLFKLQCQGSIMSTPVCVQARSLSCTVVASQDGFLRALARAADNEAARPLYRHVWEHSVGSPVFAGLVATCEIVIACDVTGCVHGVAIANGELLWQQRCGANGQQNDGIFVTPSLLSDDEVVVSLRSGRLQSLSVSDGLPLWSIAVAADALTTLGLDPAREIYQSSVSIFGCVAAADGSVSVFLFTPGTCLPPVLISRIALPASVFCAPLMCGRRVLVGCRDDALYCLELDTVIGTERPAA